MMYRFEYKAYRRSFAGVFANAREQFPKREGALVRIEDDDGRVGFGEAAPIVSFGAESFPSLLAAAEGIGKKMEFETVRPELGRNPCLLWAIESAQEMIEHEGMWPELDAPWPVCGLVSDLGNVAGAQAFLQMGYRCLKFKIGKSRVEEELKGLDRIVDLTEGKIGLRLDANGSLDGRQAREWLERLAELPVEFLEQPMAVGSEREMRRLGDDFSTPIALDESACSVDDLKRWRDEQWPGLLVIKPSLAGSLVELRSELQQGAGGCVFSSSLETKVGAANAIGFAIRYGGARRALGFGVARLFADKNIGLDLGPFLQNGALPDSDELQSLWNLI